MKACSAKTEPTRNSVRLEDARTGQLTDLKDPHFLKNRIYWSLMRSLPCRAISAGRTAIWPGNAELTDWNLTIEVGDHFGPGRIPLDFSSLIDEPRSPAAKKLANRAAVRAASGLVGRS